METFQPLTPEQYKKARGAGFSPEKIVEMERVRKSQLQPTEPKSLGQKVMSGAQKVSDFFGGKGITDYLGAKIAKATVPEDAKQYVEEPTGKEVLGSALQLGSTFTPIGRVAGAVTKGVSKLPQLAKYADKIGDVASLGGAGYGFDVGANLQEGKTGADILTPGLGTGIGVGIPLVAPVTKAIGRGIKQATGVSTGVGSGVLEETLKASMAGGKQAQALREARRGVVSPEQIVQEGRNALFIVKETRRVNYENSLRQIAGDTKQYKISPIIEEIQKGLQDFNVTVRNGELDFSRSPIRFNRQAQEDIQLVFETMKGFGTRKGDRTAVGIDSLKQALGDLYTPSSQARAFIQRVKGATRNILKDVKGYDEMSKAYETSTDFIKELERGLSLGDKSQADTAFRKLTGALRTNNELRKQLIKELDEVTGGTLTARIAGQQTSEVVPRGLAKFVSPGIATGVGFSGAIIPALMGLAVSSPRLVGGIIDALGVSLRKGKELKQLFGVIKSPGDVILESKPGKLAEKKVTEYAKNPKLGLGMEDVSNPLFQEARKYKTAEEFVKAKANLMHGSSQGGLGSRTDGIYLTPDKKYAKTFAGENGVIENAFADTKKVYQIKNPGGNEGTLDSVYVDSVDRIHDGLIEAPQYNKEIIAKLKEQGYDAIRSSDKRQLLVLDKSRVLTPSQLTDIWNKANKLPEKPQALPYKETGDLTTKILKDLEGKTTVSKQYLLDATNRGELKQVERDLIRDIASREGDTINVPDFAKKVKAELLPLKVSKARDMYSTARGGTGGRYENIALPDDLRGSVKNYEERIYESPIKTSAGEVHFGQPKDKVEGYFGHTRIEDMADNKTRRVIEVQSDLYQKGNLERELGVENSISGEKMSMEKVKELYPKKYAEIQSKQKLSQYNDPTAHFRMIREEIKKAAQDGKTKLQFPTGETAMKIEGLGDNNRWSFGRVGRETDFLDSTKLSKEDIGKLVSDEYSDWIITDVLGDGKFKAVTKEQWDRAHYPQTSEVGKANFKARGGIEGILNEYKESFDISGKVDTNNPIYKFYEKDVAKYLNKFGGKRVVDDKGVSWIEVPITKEQGKMPVEAFGVLPFLNQNEKEN